MRQILQDLRSGETFLAEVPDQRCSSGCLLIQTRASLVSIGTERMLIDFGKAGWIHKALQQPERVRQVLAKIKTDGLIPTIQSVRAKLDQPVALGYCNVGSVLEIGADMARGEFTFGDRVVSNGPHAERVCIPWNLCARIPDRVSDEEATFTVVGAIALHGIRLASPTFGERFLVIGLGLIGLLTVQLLRANGCEVLGADVREDRLRLAEQFGATTVNAEAKDIADASQGWTHGIGVDGVIITASAQNDDVMHQAAEACRKRARIILVGVVDLELQRDDFYKKELKFQVSCSYGPGRYDYDYEQRSFEYPLPYVRWTEQRNFVAVLNAMSSKALNVTPLITHRFPIEEAISAYEIIQRDVRALGVVLQFQSAGMPCTAPSVGTPSGKVRPLSRPGPAHPRVALIGAGNHAHTILAPALANTLAGLVWVADRCPAAASHLAQKHRFERATTDYRALLGDPEIEAVFVATSHESHAQLVCEALSAGKHVFVEKPLCLLETQLEEIVRVYRRVTQSDTAARLLMVGFNRRFSPHTRRIRELLADRLEPLCMNVTVNAGPIAVDHWLQDPARGGGRIIGEGCHFIDLLACLAGAQVKAVSAMMAGSGQATRSDKMSIQLSFVDGSIGTLNYFANGSKGYPKETLEIFSEGRIVRLDNFRITHGYGFKHFRKFRTWRQDKGHQTEIAQFINNIGRGGEPLIPFAELENVTRACFAAVTSSLSGTTIQL
jgi:predicted dehydrogenase/threonine dehydrogenase-like Zn-dependent dehydrogenase